MDKWDLFEDEGVVEGDGPEEQEAWFDNLRREISELNRAAETWFGNLERAKQDTTRVDLPAKLFKHFGQYFTFEEKREYFDCRRKCNELQQCAFDIQPHRLPMPSANYLLQRRTRTSSWTRNSTSRNW